VISAARAKDPARRPDATGLAARLRAAVGSGAPGAGRLPVHPREGTVVLPKLAGEPERPAKPAPVAPSFAPAPAPAAAAVAAAPTRPISAYSGNAAPPPPLTPPSPVRGTSTPNSYPPQPVFPGPSSIPARPRDAAPARGAYAPQSPQPAYRPPQQQRIAAPAPQRQPAPGPMRQAPRQPRPAGYDPAPGNGIGCLGKLAILLIVLALAALIGVEIGNRIANNRNGSGLFGHHASISQQLPGFRGSPR